VVAIHVPGGATVTSLPSATTSTGPSGRERHRVEADGGVVETPHDHRIRAGGEREEVGGIVDLGFGCHLARDRIETHETGSGGPAVRAGDNRPP
jgi:hypothetical protein